MNWEISGKDIVIIDNKKFYVGATWLPAVKDKSGIGRKLKINNLLLTSGSKTGCTVESKHFAQIASCDSQYLNLPLLSTYFIGSKNTLFFAKVSDELFWVVSFDADGCADIAGDSDSVKELYSIRDYIREVVDLSDSSEEFKIVNIGDSVFLDDPTLDPRIINNPLTEEDLVKIEKSTSIIKNQAGNLKSKLYIAGLVLLLSTLFLMFTMVNSVPQAVVDIKDGEHSHGFTTKYNKLKRDFNKILSEDKRSQQMSLDKLISMGREEFNDYVLSRGLSNEDILSNILDIRNKTPLVLLGWERTKVEYVNDKFQITYVRLNEHPLSATYKEFDESFITNLLLQHKITASTVSLTAKGSVRVFDINIERHFGSEYAEYLEGKRKFNRERNQIFSELRIIQQRLDSAKNNIETVEASVDALGLFERRDNSSISSITKKIEEINKENKHYITSMTKKLDEYNNVKEVLPPMHNDRLLSEMGIVSELYPMFQSTSHYTWSEPIKTHSFPSGVLDERFKEIKTIQGSSIKLQIKNGIFGIWSVLDVIRLPYVFVDGLIVTESKEGPKVNVDISINELNQDYIS